MRGLLEGCPFNQARVDDGGADLVSAVAALQANLLAVAVQQRRWPNLTALLVEKSTREKDGQLLWPMVGVPHFPKPRAQLQTSEQKHTSRRTAKP